MLFACHTGLREASFLYFAGGCCVCSSKDICGRRPIDLCRDQESGRTIVGLLGRSEQLKGDDTYMSCEAANVPSSIGRTTTVGELHLKRKPVVIVYIEVHSLVFFSSCPNMDTNVLLGTSNRYICRYTNYGRHRHTFSGSLEVHHQLLFIES